MIGSLHSELIIAMDTHFNDNDENDSMPMTLKESMMKYEEQWKKRDKARLKIINRRKVKLFEMIRSNDEYFSEENIKRLDPILYEYYIGWRENMTPSKSYNNTRKNMSNFLLNQIDKESFEEELSKSVMNDMNAYGKDNVINEMNQVKIVNSRSDSTREDDADELIRLMFIRFLYSNDIFSCDDNSDYDDDNEADRFDEDNYFNIDD